MTKQSKKLNIAFFIDTFYPMVDGVITVVDSYAKRLCKYANVTVFAPAPRDKNYIDNFPYTVIRCKRFCVPGLDYDLAMPTLDRKFKRYVDNGNFDIVHIHSPFTLGKLGVNYAQKYNVPVVGTMHSQFKQDFFKATKNKFISKILLKMVMRVFNKCNVLNTMNPACVQLAKDYGFNGKIQIVPNGTDLEPNNEITTLSQVLKKKNVNPDTKVFLSVGRLNKLKNLDLTLETLAVLKIKNFKYKAFIIGSGQDEKYFKNKAKELQIEKDVIFVGKVTDTKIKSAYYCMADLHLFPSFYDTDGIVKIEAATFNTPTIFSMGSIAGSTCTDNVDGYIAPANKIDFSNKILEIFNDEQKYQLVCDNCNKNLYIHWDTVVKIILEQYKQLTNK